MKRSSTTMAAGVFLSSLFLLGGLTCANAASYIDEYNRFILNGDPFFPLGLYVAQCSTVDQSAQLDEIAGGDSPFNTLMNYNTISCGSAHAEDAQITNYLDQLQSRGLKLIFYLYDYFRGCENTDGLGESALNAIADKVNTFKNHAAVLAWYFNEERGPTCLPELEVGYELIAGLDDAHPIWSVHWNTDWLTQQAHTTDIVGMDSYPIDNLPITAVSYVADEARKSGKPLWFVPQIFNWKDYPGDFRWQTGRPPTREEMRAMTYLAVNHGAKGLIYYSYFDIRNDDDYEERWLQIKEIASEIQVLRNVLLSIDQTNNDHIDCSRSDVIDCKLMRQGDSHYLFAVNTAVNGEGDPTSIAEVSFDINMKLTSTAVDTLFEGGRQLDIVEKRFVDDFGPYEVHVYNWQSDIDADGDGVIDEVDNCPHIVNPNQEDGDGDTVGDVCDNCPSKPNPGQEDEDGNGIGDACEQSDSDDDGLPDTWEQHIIDFDPNDDVETIYHVSPSDDFDGDGYSNMHEYVADTDPTDENDYPRPDFNGDGIVNYLDLCLLADYWLFMADAPGWDPKYNLSPIVDPGTGRQIINYLDLGIFADHWLEETPCP